MEPFTLQKLREMRELLSDRSRWTQRYFARDKNSKSVDPLSDAACRWCMEGAVTKVLGSQSGRKWDLMVRLCDALPTGESSVTPFNDQHTHKEVLGVIDKAILQLEKTL